MANSGAFHPTITLQALIIISVLSVLVADVGGQNQCPHFSCGDLRNISYPFRRPGDPSECGIQAYELICSSSKATIYINTGTYFVTRINYTDSSFWVVDANLDMHSSCPLPRWDQLPYQTYNSDVAGGWPIDSNDHLDLATADSVSWACYVNCSREITNNNTWYNYKPVTCLSANNSFVYVWITWDSCSAVWLEPSCGYLAMIPFGDPNLPFGSPNLENASYAVITEAIKNGFPVSFPIDNYRRGILKECLKNSIGWSDLYMYADLFGEVLCRLVLAPLAVLTFLAYKYWKTRITIDAVEKFLRMQQMIGPTRYAYTDITAITSHFRDKLGQGGYDSVYKGTILPGEVLVAVSEVSTIGRIHHVNVVRLVGFCSEEMRRALVYEYMPRGSLDKYIFLAEKSFSWDKLNEIALGIARGINYLHQGCDMQILHFDIKPHNILLDSNSVPKVADFGLAKLYPRDNSFVPLSALRGTVGYIAPEMISRSFGVISSKSDVYSFGMLLLEMAGGRRNADPNAANSSQAYYPSWVYSRLARREMGEIADSVVGMHELERKLCVIGLQCIQMKSHDRPTMSEVIEMLKGGADDGLQVPPKPFFCEDERFPAVHSYHFSSEPKLTEISEEDE